MYKKEFEIRWSDIDANMHLANTAYTDFVAHTRMSFFADHGFTLKAMTNHNLGPVVFYEHLYYFKETYLGTPITVTLEVTGLSEDGKFFRFVHNFYDDKGINLAHSEIFGAWIDTKKRILTALPESLLILTDEFEKSKDFKILTKEDTRKYGKKPVHLFE
jgi:acyl-CoA thioester hydrolase